MKKLLSYTALATVLILSSNAHAAGFHLKEQSAAAQGNAFAGATAGAEDVSYAFFNVAGLTRHKGTQINVGSTYIAPGLKTSNISGTTENIDNIIGSAVVPNMNISHQLNDKVTLGLGVNVPFGMTSKYDQNWAGSKHGVTSKVTSATATPMIAYKLNNKLSVGAGLPIQYLKAKLTQTSNVPMAGTYNHLEGDTVDVGYQLGAMYEFNENTRIGANYRSEVNHKLKGDLDLSNNDMLLASMDINARIDTPATLSFGAFHKINDKWEVMAEYQKVFWSSFDSIDVYTNSIPVPSQPQNWEDTNYYALGANYNLNDQWKLRFDVAHDDAAVKVDYRSPRVPDTKRMWYSIGTSYKHNDKLTFNLSYTLIKCKEGSVVYDDVQVDYKNTTQLFGLSMDYKF